MKNTQIINRFLCLTAIGLLGLVIANNFTVRTNAQTDLKTILAGESSKIWQLKEIKTAETNLEEEDFDENKEFVLKSQLAQIVPETISFKTDGTCENTYVSQYEEGKISDDDYIAPCKWSVVGNTVEIIENINNDNKIEESRNLVFWLKDVEVNGKEFKSKFSLQGDYTAGVEQLEYETE